MNDLMPYVGYLAAALTTIAFLPQTVMTIRSRDTRSLSLAMYSLFTLGVLCWGLYGIYRQDWPIILANSVTLCLAGCILAIKLHNRFWRQLD